MANTFLPTNQVGSPCEIFSQAPGSARQMRRTRSIASSPFDVTAFLLIPNSRGPVEPNPDNVIDGRRFAAHFSQPGIDLTAMIKTVKRHLQHGLADCDGRR